MRFLIPETIFDFLIENKEDYTILTLKEKLIGDRLFSVSSLFGNQNAKYQGEYDRNQIKMTRKIESLYRIPIYPTSNISINNNVIKVKCTLSNYWVVFIYFIYAFMLLGFIFNWTHLNLFQAKIFLACKFLISILIFNTILLGYHFSEVNNIKKILKEILK